MSVSTKRISKHINNSKKMEYAVNGFEVFAQREEMELTEDGVSGGGYSLSTWHNGNHTETQSFDTIEELATAMKQESGDLRVWKVVSY